MFTARTPATFLSDAHSKGLKLGIYSAHGSRTCMGNAASGPDNWTRDANLFASWGIDYLKLDSCGGYPANYTAGLEQYREYAAMRDALNATGRPIYYSICEIVGVEQTQTVLNSPSSCGHAQAYSSLAWKNASLDVRGLANSVLVEWVNNNNYFCRESNTPAHHSLSLQPCKAGSAQQNFSAEVDGSIRLGGSSDACLDVYNCDKADGTTLGVFKCHPSNTAECGYSNQQFVVDAASSNIRNRNSNTCLTLGGATGLHISACKPGSAEQNFHVAHGAISTSGGRCLTSDAPTPADAHCCSSGWVSQIDSQQDLTIDSLSGPGYWNDNDMLSVGCNEPNVNGTPGTPCAGFQSMVEQKGQFALWCIQASPLILGHDVTKMGPEVRAIITNPEMLALNQDKLGHRGEIVFQPDPYRRTITTFVKKLANTTSPRAAAVFNRGASAAKVTLTRAQMGFDAGTCACVELRDVDARTPVASGLKGADLITLDLEAHEVKVVRATCC